MNQNTDDAHLKVDKLSIAFHPFEKPTVCNLSFSLKKGQCLAIIGESGSGKSMTARALNQCLPHGAHVSDESAIYYQQEDLLTRSEKSMQRMRGRHIGYIPQEAQSAFNPVRTIGEQMRESITTHLNHSRSQCDEIITKLLLDVGLKHPRKVMASYPHELSGGMLQRALIASVLGPSPDLIIADEPTTALDATLQTQLIALLHQIQQKRQMTMIFITHNLLLVEHIADHIMVMRQGCLVEKSQTASFFKHPKHAYSQALLHAARPKLPWKTPKNDDILYRSEDLQVPHPSLSFWQKKKHPPIIENIHLSLKKGQTLAIVGESGSGKTTLIKALMGLMPWQGQLTWMDQPCQPSMLHPKRQQVLFQNPYAALNPKHLLKKSLDEACSQANVPIEKWDQTQDEALESVGLCPSLKSRYPHALSGGQRQRFCLARLLFFRPELLCLDEPTSALDVSVQTEILKLLQSIQEQRGCTYLLITHDWLVVQALSHEVMVLKEGRIIEHGPTHTLMQHPKKEYTKKLLNACPFLHPTLP